MAAESWLPAESIYLEKAGTPVVRRHRPWNQGDIFEAPIAVLGKPKKHTTGEPLPDPKTWTKTKSDLVALLGHPCSVRGGATPAMSQNVAHVRPAKEKELADFAEADAQARPWDTHYKLFPLPGFRDDDLWVVDFNILGTVFFTSLKGQRVACLSKEGWAAFQIRYAWHALRLSIPYAVLLNELTTTWNELDLWEKWNARGCDEAEFQQTWLEEPSDGETQYAGTRRRNLLEFAPDVLLAEMPEASSTAEPQSDLCD